MTALTDLYKGRLIKRASRASVATAVILLIAKFVVWMSTGSVSILATFMDSMLDGFTSLINLVAVSIALRPADEDHQFGHGKAEQLAALAQSAFIAGSGLFLILHALESIQGEVPPLENSQAAISVMVFSTVLTLVLVFYQAYVVRKTGSLAIESDAMHYRMDLLTNLGVILALVLSQAGFVLADPVIGMIIALYMIVSVGQIAWRAIQMLMDRALDDGSEETVTTIARSMPQVLDIHNLRTRLSGITPVIQFDLDLDGRLTLEQAHCIGKEVKNQILAELPSADITIHLDPMSVEEMRARRLL